MKKDINLLIEQEESPILEFKRQWYWDEATSVNEMPEKWGELLKDIISLANGYINNVGEYRYLIFGFSEIEKKIYHIDLNKIKKLSNINSFKKTLLQKLENLTKPSLLDINIEIVTIKSESLLVFEIAPPTYLIELKRELQTKTRHLDEGSVLIRKGQKSDEVRTASPQEIEFLKRDISIYRESSLRKKSTETNEPPISEKSIEKTIQLFIDKNASFSLSVNYPVKERNWRENIIFEVYRLEDGLSGLKEFVYIHESSNQGKTLAEIKRRQLLSDASSSIVLIDRPKIKDVERRKSNIKKLFNTDFIFFIDEFGYEHLYKDCILPYEKFNLPVYVNGLYDEGENLDLPAIERLKDWFHSENEPLFVVSGHGGIGKTTLAKQFLDFISDESHNTDSGILFIDSKEIIGELSRNFSIENKVSDVFDFYKALMDADDIEGARFDKDLLQLSIDNGSLIVVLDGIDEVIAKLGDKFDVEKFITSIFNEYSSGLHKTKVLITCRDHFWNEVGKAILLPEITLKAFNEDLAKDFFEQKLRGDKKKAYKAMAMAEQLAIENSQTAINESKKTYIPFLLDMIGYLINSQSLDNNHKQNFDSRYLTPDNHTDQLVGQVCRREIVKLASISIDQQIELFIRMALSKQNGISLYDIKSELRDIVSEFDDTLIEKIKGHPLIQCNNNRIYFRYDVFDIYFKALLVFYFFKQKDVSSLSDEMVRVVSGYLKYDSSFTATIAEKLILDDELIIFCIDVIESRKNDKGLNHEMFVSSIVSLLLTLLQDGNEKQSNLKSRTTLLEELFGTTEELVGVCLVDIFGNTSSKPTFDFRGKKLRNCTFNNYEYFWECSMDENTIFQNSIFKGIDPRAGVNFRIPDGLFSNNCDLSLIQHLLTEKQEESKNSEDSITKELLKVFKLFYQRGNFYARKQEEVRKKLSSVNLLQELLDKQVIINFKDPKKPTLKQYRISDDYKSVIDHIEQGSPSRELQVLIKELI